MRTSEVEGTMDEGPASAGAALAAAGPAAIEQLLKCGCGQVPATSVEIGPGPRRFAIFCRDCRVKTEGRTEFPEAIADWNRMIKARETR